MNRLKHLSGKLIVLILVLFFTQCRGIPPQHRGSAEGWDYDKEKDDDKCYQNGSLSASKRLAIYPFNEAKEVKIISFNDEENPLQKDSLNFGKVKESITLNAKQINDLTHILYNFNYSKKRTSNLSYSSFCYYPRHAVVFYDGTGKMFAYMEYCFECSGNSRSSEKVVMGDFCQGKYGLLKTFFLEQGIVYFGDL